MLSQLDGLGWQNIKHLYLMDPPQLEIPAVALSTWKMSYPSMPCQSLPDLSYSVTVLLGYTCWPVLFK